MSAIDVMRFAIADPPYLGQGKRIYGKHHESASDFDDITHHEKLIARLMGFDAWAMCASSPSLIEILPRCPKGVRVGAWVKPFAVFKPNVNPAYTWEPVIFWGGRKRDRKAPTVRDWVSVNITLRRGLVGAKPETFCHWLFDFLGARPSDEMFDLFPGSGAVTRAWKSFTTERLFPEQFA